ncbi:hypothetical protein BGS_1370 [Beggiatoa sp. SS]|nr:hypothetical protein BGS_1370 [Beggiatoa sp. SS]
MPITLCVISTAWKATTNADDGDGFRSLFRRCRHDRACLMITIVYKKGLKASTLSRLNMSAPLPPIMKSVGPN